jgi:hypothetical protein
MTVKILLLGLLALQLPWALATSTANSAYIHDLDGLLNSVDSRDVSRPQLTLKLADALFNEALTLSADPAPTGQIVKQITSDRKRSVQMYSEALSGLKGLFPVPSGAARSKIQFQLARLYGDLGDSAEAEKIWKGLAEQDVLPDVQRESLLRLAEVLENRSGRDDLKLAEKYYRKALSLCTSQDVCSYSHYRLAWVIERQTRPQEAIDEMNQALWDVKGQVREESLRDLVGFMGALPDDGKDSLDKMEKLSARLKRPQLISDLSDAYFAHGNRKAGVYILDAVNRKNPTLKGYVRLMEEDYGFRDWAKFNAELDSAMDLATKGPTNPDAETEKIMRRLTVQLDGERATQANSAEGFKKSVLLYLALFPQRAERPQMIDGWIAAESDDNAKINQLKIWIQEEKQAGRPKEEQRLRKMRAATAQKTKNYAVVAEEMTELKGFAGSETQKREVIYQVAYARYQNKEYDKCLATFIELAAVPKSRVPDKWAIQSEHLALDILAQRKDYAAVVSQAQLWTKDPRFALWLKEAKDHKDELADIQKVETSARFEWATSLGNDKRALEVFAKYCADGVLAPKSCSNAQVLAVKLGEQTTLIELLKKQGKNDELAAELEASGEFAQAAQLVEKLLKNKGTASKDFLKVALLYELGGNNVNRDRILHEMITFLAKQKALGEEEPLIRQTLLDAEMINVATLKLPWSKENREYLSDLLVSRGKGTPDMQAQLVKMCRDTGPGWRKVTLVELRKLDDKQKAIHFAGNGSKRKFEARVSALKALGDKANCYMESTTAEQRVIIGTLVARSSEALAAEIKASPIPEGVDEEGRVTLQKALDEMSQPYVDKAAELQKLVSTQLDKIEDLKKRDNLKAKVAAKDDTLYATPSVENTADLSPKAPLKVADAGSADVLKTALEELHRNPNQRQILSQLKSYYESNGNSRLAAYFQGRLLQLGEEVKQ